GNFPCFVRRIRFDSERTPVCKVHGKTAVLVSLCRSNGLAKHGESRTECCRMCRGQLIRSLLLLKNKAAFKADRGGACTLPQFKREGVVHKTAGDRFPLEGHKPIIIMLYNLILHIYRGHPGSGPS